MTYNIESEKKLNSKNISELNRILIALKTKHYQEGLTLDERKLYHKAKALYKEKEKELPPATIFGSSCNIYIDV